MSTFPEYLTNLVSVVRVSEAGKNELDLEKLDQIGNEMRLTRRKLFQTFVHYKMGEEVIRIGNIFIPTRFLTLARVQYLTGNPVVQNLMSYVFLEKNPRYYVLDEYQMFISGVTQPVIYIWSSKNYGVVMKLAPLGPGNPHQYIRTPELKMHAIFDDSALVANAVSTYYTVLNRWAYAPKRVAKLHYRDQTIRGCRTCSRNSLQKINSY